MTLRLTAVLVLLVSIGGLGLAGSLKGLEIVDAVNAKLPEQERFEPLGWYFTKTRRLFREYRRLYPFGRLMFQEGVLAAVMVACLTLATGLLGFGIIGIIWIGGGGTALVWFVFFRSTADHEAG